MVTGICFKMSRYIKSKGWNNIWYNVSEDVNVGLVRDNWMGYRVTEDMVWFLKFDYIENAECAIGDVPEVLREYVESGFFEIDKRRVMSNRKLLLGSCYGDL